VDRSFEIDAATVRIMKSKKQMGHTELVNEIIKVMASRGTVEISQIKTSIGKYVLAIYCAVLFVILTKWLTLLFRLIEKEYLERDEDTGGYLYVS
jgi:hypothetical protein